MTTRISILVVLAGCNRLLGLSDVVVRDASSDASSHCPDPGVVPQYSSSITQYAILSNTRCGHFQFDTARDYSITRCYDPVTCAELTYGGPLDGPATIALSNKFSWAVLDPDGITLYAFDIDVNGFVSLRRDTGSWGIDQQLPFGTTFAISTVARAGGVAHILGITGDPVDVLRIHEWVGANGSWSEQGTYYTAAMLGLLAFDTTIDLSPDGLRVIVAAVRTGDPRLRMYYLDRPAITERFGTAQPIELLYIQDPFITDDCTQVFFSDLERTFYVSRQ